ncbi:Retrovirus-related Pol polyprotein [Stylophora pistillata]|uniref:Retrovirus-related Pol polyprotein n=1 Tax=Stylophora pistillata TaxID=50429 RepID=A0A2B4S391_STYPI|nr:Retrovirus-related Pol polyprotein [Stylophora pistillata]
MKELESAASEPVLIKEETYAKGQLNVPRRKGTTLLGLPWDKENDTVGMSFPQEKADPSKRGILSKVARIYDPQGGKILYRDVCDSKLNWDARLPSKLMQSWIRWEEQLPEQLTVPRSLAAYQEDIQSIELHAFGDVSEEPDIEADKEYGLIDNMIVIKGQYDFYPDYSEEEIKSELVSLFKTKLPHITSRDFDFVRRERNTISVPVVKENHKWNFKHVKHLCATGPLYVRLNVSQETLVTSDDEIEGDQHESTKSQSSVQAVNNQPNVLGVSSGSMQVGATDEVECYSSPQWSYQSVDSSFIDNGVESLSSIFTSASRETVRDSLLTYQDIGLPSDALSESTMKEAKDDSVHQILNGLKLTMKPYMCLEKLKVDREDIVMDFFQFYISVHFDPAIPIKVQGKGEPAVDTGGLLRQAFTDVFTELASDDLISSGPTSEKAKEIKSASQIVFAEGTFELHKWHLNMKELESAASEPVLIKEETYAKGQLNVPRRKGTTLLGLPWDKENDTVGMSFPQEKADPSKRGILSKVARIYDPQGGKILYRDVCDSKLNWDARLPSKLMQSWIRWEEQLPEQLTVPRSLAAYQEDIQSIELHAFGDVSEKLITQFHLGTLHGEVVSTMATVRELYWVLRLRRLTKRIVKSFHSSLRFQAQAFLSPPQGDLPRDHTEGQTPFQVVGVNYAGPLKYHKNAKTEGKAYVLLYACSLTRALFLDLLPNLETKEFLASFKHFIARRGRPQKGYSDNGRTFVGAAQWIKQVMQDERFQNFVAYQGIKWQFNLSHAPWWGGQFERMVGLVKGAFYKCIGNSLLSWIELEEVLLDIEVALNNRPLSYPDDDIQLPILTPSSFLYGQPNMLPELEPHCVQEHDLQKRAKYLRKCKDTPWSRWTREYLHGLRERHRLKHKGDVTYPSRGEVVIIKSEEKNRAQWKLGVVEDLITGRDGVIRGAKLKSGKVHLEHPIQHLYPLELSCDKSVQTPPATLNADTPVYRPRRDAAAAARLSKVFSVLEATSGYWQVKLDEASSKLCTFHTPFGRYRFTRLPFGIKSATGAFQNHMTEMITDVEEVKVIADDLLVWGEDDEEHDARLKQVLTKAREVILKFNAKKCKKLSKQKFPMLVTS